VIKECHHSRRQPSSSNQYEIAMVQFYRYTRPHPHPDLIQGIWSLMCDDTATEFELVSDGYPEIIFHLSGKIRFEIGEEEFEVDHHCVVGNIDTYIKVYFEPGSVFISLKLMPWALPHFIGSSACEVTNKVVPLDTYGPLPRTLQLNNNSEDAVFECIQSQIVPFIDNLTSDVQKTVPLLSSNILQLFEDVQNLSLDYKNGFSGSKRYFEKLYKQHVGLSPMKYRRLLKIKKASLLLADSQAEPNMTSLALALGYFDLSHFNKDFYRFTKTAPTQFVRKTGSSPVLINDEYKQQYEYS
ncbi:MAG: helix-turn-helix domain-containing protein, partial [Bacteroidota bacterium]